MNLSKKAGLAAAAAGVALVAAVLLTNIDDIFLSGIDAVPPIKVDDPFQTYDISSECELLYLFFAQPNQLRERLSFIEYMGDEGYLERKYPGTVEKLKAYANDPKNFGAMLQSGDGQLPPEVSDVFYSIIMNELSADPKLRPELDRVLSDGVTSQEKYMIGSGLHPCNNEIQEKLMEYQVSLDQSLRSEQFLAEADKKRTEIMDKVKTSYQDMLDGKLSEEQYIQKTRIAMGQLDYIKAQGLQKTKASLGDFSNAFPVSFNKSIDKVVKSIIIAKLARDEFSEDEILRIMEIQSIGSFFEE